ncbi:MAG TPA: sulfatase-like hydrolase/transferase [Bryobacteraceae bacterium]|nr:sulfatase-like hydrolase/transferase [Bryobacteraceae bacterium]
MSTVSRRNFFGGAAGVSATALSGMAFSGITTQSGRADTVAPAANRRPNFIFFMPDELRADALSCYGNPVCKTPNLDRLASQGTKFSQCHVSYPVCGASRCSLLTGWPASVRGHRSLYYFLRSHEPNLFRYLKNSGYDVYWYGKNDALAAESFPDSVTEWNYFPWETRPPRFAAHPNPYNLGDPMYYSFLYNEGGDRRQTADYHNLQAAIRILERKESDRPFCIFLPLSYPHPPYAAPQGFHDLYNPDSLPPLRSIGLPRKPEFHAGIRKAYGIQALSEKTFRKIRAVYLGMVSYTDWLAGELADAIDRTGHSGDTALFVFSDHGDYGGDYGLVEKWPSGLEDCLTHVPLIARVPGGAAGHTSGEIVELFDVMATSLALAGIQAQHTHFARNLLPQIQGQPGDANRAAFAEGGYNIYEPQCFEPSRDAAEIYHAKCNLEQTDPETVSRAAMVRTQTHKLILRPNGQSELYAYDADPNELHNLYGESSAARVQHELERRLAMWYVNTTGIAPFDKDQRNAPPFYPVPTFDLSNWQAELLDKTR